MYLSPIVVYLISIIACIGFEVGLWFIFKKAGEKPWKSLIPIYNMWVWLNILSRPKWWIILILFPFIGFFMFFLMVWKTIRLFRKTSYLYLLPGTFFYFLYLPYLGISKKEKYTTLENLPKFNKSGARDWCDAAIFAIAAAYVLRSFLFELYAIPTSSMESSLMVGDYLAVDKVSYGARIPMTPLAIPFVHHSIPGTASKSYVEWLKLPSLRFPKTKSVERGNSVVFNYPDGDTVVLERQAESYYAIVREFETLLNPNSPQNELTRVYQKYSVEGAKFFASKYPGQYYLGKGRDAVKKEYNVVARHVDKREFYVKRCMGLPGEKFEVNNTNIIINDLQIENPKRVQFLYYVIDSMSIGLSSKKRKALNINEEDMWKVSNIATQYCLNNDQKTEIQAMGLRVVPLIDEKDEQDLSIFPHDKRYFWNKDFFGPITIPAKGATVIINDSTIVLYSQIIRQYENHDLKITKDAIYVDGKIVTEYTFAQNYYFLMGDNRHNSADSRFWGFVPEDHIAGKVWFVWLSLDKYKSLGDGKIRWNRMFRRCKNN